MTHHTLKPWLLTATIAIASLASCASSEEKAASQPTIERIEQRGKMLVGTTGDYRPLSFREEDGTYWGFGIEMANEIAKRMGVTVEFVQTSWPTLTADVQAERWTAGHPPFRICH